jgi:hypothetical protein
MKGKVDPLAISHAAVNLAVAERLSWDALTEQACEIVVFGSRAAGLQRRGSDLDVLCIGAGERVKTSRLDIIWKTAREVESERWLSSELAGHVGAFGIWLRGSGGWKDELRPDNRAVDHKRKRILALVDGLHVHWKRLDDDFHQKYLTVIRRDVQRLQHLAASSPVPATPVLDSRWLSDSSCILEFDRFIRAFAPPEPGARDRLLRVADLICSAHVEQRPNSEFAGANP